MGTGVSVRAVDRAEARRRMRRSLDGMAIMRVAEELGFNRKAFYSCINSGGTKAYASTFAKTCDYLGISVDWLLYGYEIDTDLPGKTLGARLKAAMYERGYSTNTLALKSRLGNTTVRHACKNDMDPRMSTIIKLAETLDVSVDWLLGIRRN